MRRVIVITTFSIMALIGFNTLVGLHFTMLGDGKMEFALWQRHSKNGYGISISPFRRIEVCSIVPNVHGGLVESPPTFELGK